MTQRRRKRLRLWWAMVVSCLALSDTKSVDAQGAEWSIDTAPVIEIGAGVRDEADQLGRVITAQRLGDGSIAVLDAMLPAVRIYDARGRHVRDIGRSGDGPGEFRGPLALVVVADTIVVLDDLGRVTRFGARGNELRTDRSSLEGLFDPRYNGVHGGLLSDGSLLVLGRERLFGRVTGEYRQTVGMMRMADNGVPDTIGWFAADSIRTDRAGVPVPRPYTPAGGLLWSAAGDRIFVVTADRPILHSFARDGTDARRVRIPLSPRPVTDADVAEVGADLLRRGGTANDRRVIAEWVGGLPRSRVTPLVQSIVAAGPEEVWLESWSRTDGRTEWLVMTPAAVRARVAAPAGCRILSVGNDWVLCLWRDKYDVEHVRLHTLRRVGVGGPSDPRDRRAPRAHTEQEMRMQLHLENTQSLLREPRFEAGVSGLRGCPGQNRRPGSRPTSMGALCGRQAWLSASWTPRCVRWMRSGQASNSSFPEPIGCDA